MAEILRRRGIPFAVIGAAALAAHGVSRATRDLDLLAVAPAALEPDTWRELRAIGVEVQIRRGDAEDPLAGVVRLTTVGEHPIDLVVGKAAWQAELVGRATDSVVEDVSIPVADRAGLVLLKLYAGSPQDAWDIEQLLACPDRDRVTAEVERVLPLLPPEARRLWERVRHAD